MYFPKRGKAHTLSHFGLRTLTDVEIHYYVAVSQRPAVACTVAPPEILIYNNYAISDYILSLATLKFVYLCATSPDQ